MTIINADDFGLSQSVNLAITEAFDKRLISSTTMLANGERFDTAAGLAKENGFGSRIGIHFNLTKGEPLTRDIKMCAAFCENGIFHHRNNRLKPLNRAEKLAVYKELCAQVEKIRAAGFEIDHADSHHHIHTAVFVAPIVFDVCKQFGIDKIRLHRNIGDIPFHKKAVKGIYNKTLRKKGFKTTDYFGGLADVCNTVPENLEIMVHPDYDKDGSLIDRRGMKEGKPYGVPLYSVADRFGVQLVSYGDL